MGSSGMKRRRKGTGGGKSGTHPQHMAKVGTSYEGAEHEQELERSAVADVMGLGNTPAWLRVGCLVVGALFLIAAIVALIAID